MELRLCRSSGAQMMSRLWCLNWVRRWQVWFLEASVQLQVVCLQQQSFSLSSARTRIRTLVLLHGVMLPIPASSVGDQLHFDSFFFCTLKPDGFKRRNEQPDLVSSADDDVTSCWSIKRQKLSSFMHSGFIWAEVQNPQISFLRRAMRRSETSLLKTEVWFLLLDVFPSQSCCSLVLSTAAGMSPASAQFTAGGLRGRDRNLKSSQNIEKTGEM